MPKPHSTLEHRDWVRATDLACYWKERAEKLEEQVEAYELTLRECWNGGHGYIRRLVEAVYPVASSPEESTGE